MSLSKILPICMSTAPTYQPSFIPLTTPFRFAKDPLAFIHNGFSTCGSTFRLHLFRDIIFSRAPAFFKHVLQQNHRGYAKESVFTELSKVLGKGLLTSEGDFWMRQRRLIQPVFHRERMLGLYRIMAELTSEFITELEKHRGQGVIDLDEKMMAITAYIALKTLFTTITNEDKATIYQQINRTQEFIIANIRKLTVPIAVLGLI